MQLITLPLESLKSLHTGRGNWGIYENDLLFKPTNHFMKGEGHMLEHDSFHQIDMHIMTPDYFLDSISVYMQHTL